MAFRFLRCRPTDTNTFFKSEIKWCYFPVCGFFRGAYVWVCERVSNIHSDTRTTDMCTSEVWVKLFCWNLAMIVVLCFGVTYYVCKIRTVEFNI